MTGPRYRTLARRITGGLTALALVAAASTPTAFAQDGGGGGGGGGGFLGGLGGIFGGNPDRPGPYVSPSANDLLPKGDEIG